MAKREIEPEPLEEEVVESEIPTVGERLRAAREEKKLSLEDVAAQTRIPRRHLESLEKSDWETLPAPTYTTGFAKSYASVVGLDRTEIGDQLRAEMGGQRFASDTQQVFEAADPARTMPKSLVLAAIGAVIVLIAVMSWLNSRSLEQPDETNNAPAAQTAAAPTGPPAANPAPQPTPASAQGPVVLTATDAVWMQVSQGDGATLFSGILQAGNTFAVPPNANGAILKTAKPEALRITVGNTVVPQVGPSAKKVTVSLAPADLLKTGAATPAAIQAPSAAPKPRAQAPRPAEAAPPPPAAPAPADTATTNSGE
jgi:cytoskeletal protein RodZ